MKPASVLGWVGAMLLAACGGKERGPGTRAGEESGGAPSAHGGATGGVPTNPGAGGTAPAEAGALGSGASSGGRGATSGAGAQSATPAAGSGSGGSGAGPSSGSGGSGGRRLENPNLMGTGERGLCNSEGWCWQSPSPVGDRFDAISDDGRYAVGENGTVFRWPDRYLPPLRATTVREVQTSGDTVWVGAWRYDGTEWTQGFRGSMRALRGGVGGELWALADGGVGHYRDDTWTVEMPPELVERKLALTDVIAVGEGKAWALATNYEGPKASNDAKLTLFEFDDGVWTEEPTEVKDTGDGWHFVRAGSQIYVASTRLTNRAIYAPAEAWSVVAEAAPAVQYVYGTPAGGLVASSSRGLLASSGRDSASITATRCHALVPVSADEGLCAVSGGGLALLPFVPPPSGEPSTNERAGQLGPELFGRVPAAIWAQSYVAWGTGPSDVWRPPLDHFDGVEWSTFPASAPSDFRASVISGTASDDVWFGGGQQVLRWDGAAFHEVRLPEVAGSVPHFVSSIHAVGPTETWIVRGATDLVKVLRFDGTEWTETLSLEGRSFANDSAAFEGGGDKPLWVGVGPGLYRLDGREWTPIASTNLSIVDIAVDGDDVWALAQDGVYQLVGGALVKRGEHSSVLQNIALTADHVWHYGGPNARTLPRAVAR